MLVSDRSEREEHAGPSETLSALIGIHESDLCNRPGSTERAFFGPAELDPEYFRVRGDLGLASLRATAELHPFGSNQTIPVRLDLDWRATDDDVLRPRYRFTTRDPDGRMEMSRSFARFRFAVASGTISDGTVDYGGTRSSHASIGAGRSSILTITR